MININTPWKFDQRGQTALCDHPAHIRQLVEAVLFTNPGERVNRIDFGCGLLNLVFEPNGPQLSSPVRSRIEASLNRWLGDLITLDELEVRAVDARLFISIKYTVIRTGQERSETFQPEVGR